MENNKTKKKLNIVDVLIIVLLILCAVGIGLRFLLVKNTPDPNTLPDIKTEKYKVSFMIRDFRESTAKYMTDGTEFRFFETNKKFGAISGTPKKENAVKCYFDENGKYIQVNNFASGEYERAARFDFQGEFLVEGKLNEEGILVIDDSPNFNVAQNKDVMLRNDEMIMRIYVTGITPAA